MAGPAWPGRRLDAPAAGRRRELKVLKARRRRLAFPVDVVRRGRVTVGQPFQPLPEVGPRSWLGRQIGPIGVAHGLVSASPGASRGTTAGVTGGSVRRRFGEHGPDRFWPGSFLSTIRTGGGCLTAGRGRDRAGRSWLGSRRNGLRSRCPVRESPGSLSSAAVAARAVSAACAGGRPGPPFAVAGAGRCSGAGPGSNKLRPPGRGAGSKTLGVLRGSTGLAPAVGARSGSAGRDRPGTSGAWACPFERSAARTGCCAMIRVESSGSGWSECPSPSHCSRCPDMALSPAYWQCGHRSRGWTDVVAVWQDGAVHGVLGVRIGPGQEPGGQAGMIWPCASPNPTLLPSGPVAVAVITTSSPSSSQPRLLPSGSVSGCRPAHASSISDPY